MGSHRDRIKMTPDEVAALLDAARVLHVASINADGSPHLVAMWYVRRGEQLVFWTYAKSQKAVNLRRDPRLTVMVEAGDRYDELRGVTVYGRATVVDDRDEVTSYGREFHQRYLGPLDPGGEAEDRISVMGAKRVVVVVEPTKVVSWDHRKLAARHQGGP
jgi:PPOX class probable F420-dependent enzyme